MGVELGHGGLKCADLFVRLHDSPNTDNDDHGDSSNNFNDNNYSINDSY